MLGPGVVPFSVTPFDEAGRFDEGSLARLLFWFAQSGCSGVVVGGDWGEGRSLSAVERRDLIRAACAAGALPVVANVNTPSLEEAVWLCEQARKAGAVAGMAPLPGVFDEENSEGLLEWCEQLIGRSPLPLWIGGDSVAHLNDLGVARLKPFLENPGCEGVVYCVLGTAVLPTGPLELIRARTIEATLKHGAEIFFGRAANVVAPWLVQAISERESDPESSHTKFRLLETIPQAVLSGSSPTAAKAVLHAWGIIATPNVKLPLRPFGGDLQALVAKTRSVSPGWA